MNKMLIAIVALCAAACADDSEATKAVEILGWSDVVVDDHADVFVPGCGRDDNTRFKVHGKNAAGQPVHAIVCCGGGLIAKACTVRSH